MRKRKKQVRGQNLANKDSERVSMHKKPGEIYKEIKGGLDYTYLLPITRRIASN